MSANAEKEAPTAAPPSLVPEAGPSAAPGLELAAFSPARVIALQRTAGNQAVTRFLTTNMLARAADQHAGTHEPDAAELADIDKAVNPTAPKTKGGKADDWDGDDKIAKFAKTFAANRAKLQAELTTALQDHLNANLPGLKADQAGPKMPMASFEGPGNAAKRLVDAKFGAFASAGALTVPQHKERAAFAFKSGAQLLDRTNPKDFTPDPADVASWMAQTGKASSAAQKAHGFNKDRSPAERAWLNKEVLTPFVAAHKADLELFDIYGFASSGETILIAPVVRSSKGFPNTPPKGGGPSRAERAKLWGMWEILVHEYIHTLEHPAFLAMRGGNRILFEGFCEMFTEEVLTVAIPKAQADADPALRGEVEGKDPGGKLWPDFTADMVADYDAGEYKDYADRAKEIRNTLGGGGENAVRAAFFQGHIELIGLGPGGKIAAPGTKKAPAGKRFHKVVASPGKRGALDQAVETAGEIATQNGITVAELKAANPGVDFTKLTPGTDVLIPVKP